MVFIEWDPKKAQSNWKKHRVSFDECATVVFDPQALLTKEWVCNFGGARKRAAVIIR